jgi:hypothetical protein
MTHPCVTAWPGRVGSGGTASGRWLTAFVQILYLVQAKRLAVKNGLENRAKTPEASSRGNKDLQWPAVAVAPKRPKNCCLRAGHPETLRNSHKTQAYLRAKAKADAEREKQS